MYYGIIEFLPNRTIELAHMDDNPNITAGQEGVFEIRDSAIDSDEIVKRIETGLNEHQHRYNDAPSMPSFKQGDLPVQGNANDRLEDLAFNLGLARDSYADTGAQLDIGHSWASQLPIIGRLWRRIRVEVHNLVLFYVNRAAAKQSAFNRHSINVMQHIEGNAEEIESLRSRIELIEKRLSDADDQG